MIKVIIVYQYNPNNIAFNVITKELLKIDDKDIDIRVGTRDDAADIYYWLSFGFFVYARDYKDNKVDLVLFNPKKGWQGNIEKVKYVVFQSKPFYESVKVEHKYLIPTGIDPDLFKPNIKIGVVASCRGGKGSMALTELFQRSNWYNFTFLICGPRWEELVPQYQKFVKLEYTPYLPYEEMPKFYQNLDYLLVPSSVVRGEGGPMVIVEALACGVPVISTDVGFARELNCTIFNNIDELVDILKKIELKEREKVSEYTWDNYRKKHVEMFKSL